MDALTHAIEAFLVSNFYTSNEDFEHGLAYEGNHPLGDLYAEQAIRLIGENIQRVHEEPDHLGTRSAIAFAATLAGMAFSSCGVCLAHALEYPIGMMYHSSHGAGNGIVLPAVMRFWLPQRTERLAKIGKLLGVANYWIRSKHSNGFKGTLARLQSLWRDGKNFRRLTEDSFVRQSAESENEKRVAEFLGDTEDPIDALRWYQS